MDRVAWNAYWLSLGLWLVVASAYAALRRSLDVPLLWAILVPLPLLVAGVNLVLFSRSHETICRIEAGRHRWLRVITTGGYSRRTFAATGFASIAVSVALAIWIAAR